MTGAAKEQRMRVLALRLESLPRGTHKRLAELAGITSETLSRWKSGEVEPTLSNLEALADAMHVSIGYLLSQESTERPTLPAVGVPDAEKAAARLERLTKRAERTALELKDAIEALRRSRRE